MAEGCEHSYLPGSLTPGLAQRTGNTMPFMKCLEASVIVVLVGTFIITGDARACDDPSLHPEIAEYKSILDSLGPQPRSPVTLKYRVEGEASVGKPVTMILSFWPRDPYDAGRYSIEPSRHVRLEHAVEDEEIPYKGMRKITFTPMRSGYHFLKMELAVTSGSQETTTAMILTVPVEVTHSGSPSVAGKDSFGFAGNRLRNLMGEREGVPAHEP